MFASGHYDWCLFVGHLALEKILKALWVKNNSGEMPPRTHNLVRLAELAGYALSQRDAEFLAFVNQFNVETRYPDYKRAFHTIATPSFAEENLNKVKDFFECVERLL